MKVPDPPVPSVGAHDLDSLGPLFETVVALDPGARAGFLAGLSDPDLRARLERLVEGDGRWDRVEPMLLEEVADLARGVGSPMPERIGPCRVLRRLGGGGMGEVYEAEEEGPIRRRVAVKVIRQGIESAAALHRFQGEIRALAHMEHPGIARVFHAGLHEGRPYLVMELVDGEPLNVVLERTALDLASRLRIFARICRAVQHAHQKGIVHRDLKPGNILIESVDGELVPRLIDFGLARAIEGDSVITDAGVAPGTAHFMSPEQARGEVRADTRTDVYALGVILYWLLTGGLPFATSGEEISRDEVLRRIREEDPPRPSSHLKSGGAIAAGMRNDLDWVVLRALERDPDRRYPFASELAGEVERFLRDEPVLASRAAMLYRVRRFTRRHRVGVLAAAGGATVLVLGFGGLVFGITARLRADVATRVRYYEFLLERARHAPATLGPGQRDALLAGLTDAAALHSRLERPHAEVAELRSAAMRALVQPQFLIVREWDGFPDGARGVHANAALTRYARGDEAGNVSIRDLATDAEILRLPGFGKSVWQVEFSPDDTHLMVVYSWLHVGRTEQEIRVWHLATATVRVGDTATATQGAFRQDSRQVVVTRPDGTLVVYDVATGLIVRRMPVHPGRPPRAARFLGGSDTLITWTPGSDSLSVGADRIRLPGPVWSVDASETGRLLAVGGTDRLTLFDRAAPDRARDFLRPFSRVSSVSFRPGKGLVATSTWDGTIRAWDAYGGHEFLQQPGVLIRWDASGTRLLYRAGTRIVLLEWNDSEVARSIAPGRPLGRPHLLATHPVEPLAVSVGGGRAHAWDLALGREVRVPADSALAATFVGDEGALLLAQHGRVDRWAVLRESGGRWTFNRSGGFELEPVTEPLWVAADPRGRVVVVVDAPTGRAEIHDFGAGASRRSNIPSHPHTLWAELVGDGGTLLTGPWNAPGVERWDVSTSSREAVLPGTALATRGMVARNRDGSLLAAYTDRPHQVCVWRVADWSTAGCRRWHAPSDLAGRVAFSPDGRWLAASDPLQGRVSILDVARGLDEVGSLTLPGARGLIGASFSGAGRYLAVLDGNHRVHAVDLAELRERLTALGLSWPDAGH